MRIRNMSKRHIAHKIHTWTLPALTKSVSDVKELGHIDEKWATETIKHKKTRNENRELLACYYTMLQ